MMILDMEDLLLNAIMREMEVWDLIEE
jgi:hypothetical protein